MSEDGIRQPNRGWFRKGQSGNPGGRPKGRQAKSKSAFDVIVDKTLTVSRDGASREITVEEALQQRTYQDALAGKRMAIREVLRWILKREQWFAKNKANRGPRAIFAGTIQDPDNADAALMLLGIAKQNPDRAGLRIDRAQLLLEPWTVAAALRRRRGAQSLTNKEISDIRRCSRDDGTLKLPAGDDP
jgi:hypothetical protein